MENQKKTIDIVVPTYNEEENVELMYLKAKDVMKAFDRYNYTLTFIDNCSKDKTREIIEKIRVGGQ